MDKLRCVVERITYQNEDNGYSVIKVNAKGYDDLITVVGNMAAVNVGSVLTILGEWKVDGKYGKQLNVVKYEETLPATVYGIEKYLGSGLIKGVGPVYAKKIVGFFQETTLEIIDEEPSRLIEVPGIGKKRVDIIKKAWQEQKEVKNVMLFLQSHGVSTAHATKIYKAYGDKSITTVKDNPYKLADDIWGIGFKTANKIAFQLGIDKESFIRCRSGILYALNELANDGHCYANQEQLAKTAVELLEIEEPKIIMSISHMMKEKEIISENNDMLYLPPFYYSEVGTAKLIKKIIESPRKKEIEKLRINDGIEYDEMQLTAIRCACESKFMVLTGGPGTGKTTTTKGIINTFKANGFNVVLAAPTGRAAKRMTETTGLASKTIHRLLEYKPPGGYQKNEENQLDGDVLIVDEASMIDIILVYNLLKAVPPQMTVIFVGDVDQLPSVGAGNFLCDIINSKRVPVIKLEKIFRQAQGSAIIRNAHKVNKGLLPDFYTGNKSDFFFIEQEDNALIPQLLVELCSKRLPRHYDLDPIKDIQVLCPMQRGETGAMNMNMLLQNALNKNTISMKRGGTEYRLGDKVMQIKNNYEKETFNGDIGIITRVDLEDRSITVSIDNKMVEYDITETDELVLAYATTRHKAQGSEYPVVVMPVSMSHYVMLQRNLIYTGITRAKKILVMVGSKKAVNVAVRNNKVTERNTGLADRLSRI